MNTSTAETDAGLAAALAEATRLLATIRFDGAGHRWLSGERVEVLVGSVGGGRGGDGEALVVTVALRQPIGGSLGGTVIELTGASGAIHRGPLDAAGQVRLPRPPGSYRLALYPASRPIPAEPVRPHRRRSRRISGRSLVGVAAAALLLLVGLPLLPGGDEAVASVNVDPVDCRNTADRRRPGHVVVAAVWGNEERERFTRVLERFQKRTGIDVTFLTNTDGADHKIGSTLQSLVDLGCPPDVALLPQPGLLEKLQGQGALMPVDDATRRLIEENYSATWREKAEVDGTSYGVWFKAANKSIIWYDVRAFERLNITEPGTWDELKAAATKLQNAGITPFSVAGENGWTLTDWFENVYLRMFPDRYEDLARHRIRWTDPSVSTALAKLAEIFGHPGWLAEGALDTTYEESVLQVFDSKRKRAAMVFEGNFVATVIAGTGTEIGEEAGYFDFPSIGRRSSPVVGASGPANSGEAVGGDVAVPMRDTPESHRLLQFLATAEAAEPWARAGGFTSPNNKLALGIYPDDATEEAARTLVYAPDVTFDLSDLQCPAFGADPYRGMWPILQEFLVEPTAVVATAQKLEEAWLPPPGRTEDGRVCPSA